MNATRREFFDMLAGGTALLTLQACGGGGGSGTGPGFGAGCNATTISGHTGHVLNVPTADLVSATSKTYSIQGTSDHDHSVTLSAAQLKDLLDGKGAVAISTSTTSVAQGAHTHTLTLTC